jgi:predicted HAD superfamily Cof-like phosphohydrolase
LAFPIQQHVIDFHNTFGHPVRDIPQVITKKEAIQAYSFIEEELQELWVDGLFPPNALNQPYDPDIIEIADALGDVVFTAYGMAVRHGIDLDRVLAAICASNMTKTANGQGKILKGENFVEPDIRGALALVNVTG